MAQVSQPWRRSLTCPSSAEFLHQVSKFHRIPSGISQYRCSTRCWECLLEPLPKENLFGISQLLTGCINFAYAQVWHNEFFFFSPWNQANLFLSYFWKHITHAGSDSCGCLNRYFKRQTLTFIKAAKYSTCSHTLFLKWATNTSPLLFFFFIFFFVSPTHSLSDRNSNARCLWLVGLVLRRPLGGWRVLIWMPSRKRKRERERKQETRHPGLKHWELK